MKKIQLISNFKQEGKVIILRVQDKENYIFEKEI